ncbi:MAG: hypothetical protein IBX70_07810 [Clostridia bacterium]|nr:hypothetical protein [Clostridia bacterium]
MYEFQKFLTSQEEVTKEVKKLIDLKSIGEISEQEFVRNLVCYVITFRTLLFKVRGDNEFVLKGTPKFKLGKKRIRIIGACLESVGVATLQDEGDGIYKIN